MKHDPDLNGADPFAKAQTDADGAADSVADMGAPLAGTGLRLAALSVQKDGPCRFPARSRDYARRAPP
jgi:hypothetical protein